MCQMRDEKEIFHLAGREVCGYDVFDCHLLAVNPFLCERSTNEPVQSLETPHNGCCYWVSTVPGSRGKGIGTAVTLAPLREAREMNYRIGILQSSKMGLGVYRTLGFEQYCKLYIGDSTIGEIE